MRSVTERFTLCHFTAAEKFLTGFFGGPFHRHEIRALVRSITKRLTVRAATRAPEIRFTVLDIYRDGGFLRDNWLVGHGNSPLGQSVNA